ncbi:MAG: DNA polymerase III subunit gamma/tau [Patescibacteria group bacterium]
MAYEVLYRKYRPKTFSEVVGQDHITSVLKGEAESGNFSHAYLFSGSRGTGKTSVARIFARALGCTEKDLYEIDAASNTGVDDVRELRDGVRTLPFDSPVKVYLIDEVHMLSKSAFNALLKTLEGPPAHVVFILATTELNKVLDTIISRCETFVFRRPTIQILIETIKKVAKKEGLKIEAEAVRLIAFLGDGSFRDCLGLLQKIISGAHGEEVTLALVEEITGLPQLSLIQDFLLALLNADTNTALGLLNTIAKDNRDIKVFCKRLLDELRFSMLIKYGPELRKEIEDSTDPERIKFFDKIASHPNSTKISAVLKELLECHDLIGTTHILQLPLELATISITEKIKNTK